MDAKDYQNKIEVGRIKKLTEYLNSSKDTKRYEKTTKISQRVGTFFIRPLLSFVHSERITLQRRSDLVSRRIFQTIYRRIVVYRYIGGMQESERSVALTGLPFSQGLFQSIRTNILMGLLGVGPDGALLALHRRATFLLVRQVG